jgi:hypothetical protein
MSRVRILLLNFTLRRYSLVSRLAGKIMNVALIVPTPWQGGAS